jgi:hypothetical protein
LSPTDNKKVQQYLGQKNIKFHIAGLLFVANIYTLIVYINNTVGIDIDNITNAIMMFIYNSNNNNNNNNNNNTYNNNNIASK